MASNKQIVLQTICYADIFDYPLTLDQLHFLAISGKEISFSAINRSISALKQTVTVKENMVCLRGREQLFVLRKTRLMESEKKMQTARKVCFMLALIPTVNLVGISGGLSVYNADKNDDIDLFIIVEKNTIWISRLVILVLLQLMGKRRKRQEKIAEDKICLNMIVDTSALTHSTEKQNIYTAHEIIQLNVLFAQNSAYTYFLKENRWVKRFLYNGYIKRMKEAINADKKKHTLPIAIFLFKTGNIFAKYLQLWYMKKKVTREVITDRLLAFHPNDYTEKVLESYNQRINRYEKI